MHKLFLVEYLMNILHNYRKLIFNHIKFLYMQTQGADQVEMPK